MARSAGDPFVGGSGATTDNVQRVVLATDSPGVASPPVGAATEANQTNGDQKTQIVDSGGANLGTVANPLEVQAVSPAALTPASPTATSVGVTSASAVAANSSRKGLVLTNTSANRISFGLGVAAVLDSGITIPGNAVWEMDSFTFTTAEIFAIASGAASNLAIQEFS